jgi:trk system potassium uptake protein TrkA
MYIVVAGINTLGRKLAKNLESNHDVVVVEEDEQKCDRLYAETGARIINANPASLSALEDAGIQDADVLVSALQDDNQNVVVTSLAKKYGVEKVLSRLEDTEYREAFEVIGVDTVEHTSIIFSEFLSKIEHPYLLKLADLPGGNEILKAQVKEDSGLTDISIDEMTSDNSFPQEFKVAAVIHEGDTFTKELEFQLAPKDTVILAGPRTQKSQLDKYLRTI